MEGFFLKVSVMLVPALLAITCHEVSHGFIADRFGDPTARRMGRLTLNPLRHLDIIGTLMIFFVGIGWAKPVPVNFGNLHRPKRDMIWVAAAGPATNFLLAAASGWGLRWCYAALRGGGGTAILEPVILMLGFSLYINLLLGLFNLIPLPPLDGGRVLVGLLPFRQAAALARVEPYGMIIIIVLVFFTDLFGKVISPFLYRGIMFLAGPEASIIFDRLFREVLSL
ncbi:MAG TPA: site-2 protease family protein [Verrucomicrobiae bacterium]|nr:site-2 protease family protein [Verrucomicrobiae bacterium]